MPFFGPLSYALDFRELDPLVGVLTVMTALESDEACVMSLALSPPTKNYPRMGAKLITESRNAWWQFITPSMAVEAFMWQSMIGIERRVPKYEADIQREAAQKLRMPLKESRLLFKIQARSQRRADDLFMQFASPVAIYGRDGLNELVPAHKDSYQLILAPPEVAALWHLPNEACNVPGITWTTDKNVPPPIELLQSTQGVLLGQTFYRGRSLDAHIADPDRGTHISVGGRTRTGKSTFVHNMVHQDIQAGKAVGVIDPHGNLVQDILQNSIPPHREDDVVLFDWDENEKVIGLNPLYVPDGVDPSTAAAVALSFMRKFFGDSWIDGRMEDTFYACIVSLMSVKGSVVPDISRILLDDVFRRQVLQHVTDFAALNYWHLEFNPASAKVKQELARPVNTRIRKLYRDKALRRIVGQPECLNFADIISGKKIFLANLRGASKLEGNSIGALLITQIQMTTMGRARQASTDRTPFYLYIDEVQNFIVTSLPEMLSEAGKYGLNLTTANQYMGQLDADTAKSMLGNIGTNIIFRSGRDDAALYAPLIEPAYTADDVVNLSRFKAFVKTQYQGNTLPAFLINTSPPPQAGSIGIRGYRAHRRKEPSEVRQTGGGNRRKSGRTLSTRCRRTG